MDNIYYILQGDTKMKKHYGFCHFLWDAFLVLCTAGLWLIWIFIREMRSR